MLNKINDSYENLKFKSKVQLYVLPLLCLYLIFFFIKPDERNKIKKNKVVDTLNKKFTSSYLDLFSKIENIAKLNNIEIYMLKNQVNIVTVQGKSSILNLRKLINYIESMNSFTNLIFVKINKLENISKYNFELNISLKSYFIKKKRLIINERIEKKKYTLTAIVDNYVFIENRWIRLGDSINKYKLIKIEKNFILLKDKEEILKVELKNDRYTKHIN